VEAAHRVLWAAAERDGGEALGRLEALLREDGDALALSRLAGLAQGRGDLEVAKRLGAALVRGEAGAPTALRLEALEQLLAWGEGASAFEPALERLAEEPPGFTDPLLALLETLAPPARLTVLGRIFEALPARQRALAEQRLSLALGLEAWPEAVEALADLEASSEDAERAAYLIARGRLTLERLGEVDKARAAFLAALALAPDSEPARTGLLLASEQGGDAASLAQDLEALLPRVSDASALPVREALARCYEALGQPEQLYLLLGELPATPEVIERRAKLAGQLGRVVEALELRERLTDAPAALEDILGEYFVADFLPGALRLTERLHREGTLSAHGLRLAAERLASTREGAQLSVTLWPELLAQAPLDADGWTLFAEALARIGRADAAAQVDGVGAALAGTELPSHAAPIRPLRMEGVSERGVPPPGLIEVGPETMPRLFEVVEKSLAGMGLGLRTWLDPHGGVEAYLLGPEELVIGAGALGALGPVEVRYLIALGLALGPEGQALRVPGTIARLPEAAEAAFDAMPSTLAAAKVIAQVDARVRGAAPSGIDAPAVLRQSEAFLRVARRALEVWGRAE
jgi:tetratricopeptide (TPR) repeat protein